jgi:predicted RNase H-like nuclease (RuvC/YqgF family)
MEEAEIVALQRTLEETQAALSDLTAERDSLAEELEAEKKRNTELSDEVAATKKLNFTLARQLDTKPKKKLEDALVEMFGKGGK